MNKLTPRQLEVRDFIKWHIVTEQRPPTREEIALHFEFGNTAAQDHVKALERKGFIESVGKGRNIKVLGCRLAWVP